MGECCSLCPPGTLIEACPHPEHAIHRRYREEIAGMEERHADALAASRAEADTLRARLADVVDAYDRARQTMDPAIERIAIEKARAALAAAPPAAPDERPVLGAGDAEIGARLLAAVRGWVTETQPSCLDSLYQVDAVNEALPLLAERACEIVGYYVPLDAPVAPSTGEEPRRG